MAKVGKLLPGFVVGAGAAVGFSSSGEKWGLESSKGIDAAWACIVPEQSQSTDSRSAQYLFMPLSLDIDAHSHAGVKAGSHPVVLPEQQGAGVEVQRQRDFVHSVGVSNIHRRLPVIGTATHAV